MSGHTPGPWVVTGPTKYLNQTQIDPSIGCVYGSGNEVTANAHLIAAAPDLLAALRGLLKWIPVYPESADGIVGGRESHAAAITAARAAIAKAEGAPS